MTTMTRKTRKAPWAVVMTVLLAVLGMVFGVMAAVPAAADPDPTQVCAPLDSGKIDLGGEHTTWTITAPAGMLITGYCVKAGSTQQGNGPVYTTLTTPVASLEISHPSGKAISNYSYSLGDAPTFYYTPSAEAKETVCANVDDVWQLHAFGPVTAYGELLTKGTEWTDQEKAAEDAKLQPTADAMLLNEESDFDIDRTGMNCQTQPTPAADVDLTCSAWSATFTDFDLRSLYRVTVDDVTVGTGVISTSPVTVGDIGSFGSGEHTVRAYVSDELVRTEAITLTCTVPTLYAGTATYPKVSVCYGPDVIEVGPIASPYGTEMTYTSQAEADAAAAAFVKANLEGATVGFMAAHPEYAPVPADGICVPPVVEAEVVAPVLPATVEEPAEVAIPAAATLPATIPAGEPAPTVPTYALALLLLGTTALAASTVRLVRTTR